MLAVLVSFRHFAFLRRFTPLSTDDARFLLTQKHLISGLPPDQREDLGERFVAALAAEHPDLGVREIAELAVATAASSSSASGGNGGGGGGGNGALGGDSFQNDGNAVTTTSSSSSNGRKRPRLWEKLKQGGNSGVGVGVTTPAGGNSVFAAAEEASVAGGKGHDATAAAAPQGVVGGAEDEDGGVGRSGGFSFGFSFS